MLELILGTIFLIYILFIGQLIYGFNRMKRFSKKEFTPKTSFTIVVPFRNEKENLPNLLHSISLLHYPKELVEVILVDDDSEEVFSVQDLVFSLKVIKNERKSNSPRKMRLKQRFKLLKTIGLLLPMPIVWFRKIG